MRTLVLASLIILGACADTEDDPIVDELEPGSLLGKEDSVGVPGLPVNGDYAATQAWTVANQWEDRTTPEARKAGPAWGADSGLDWDQKFSLWVSSFEQVDSMNGWSKTIAISTPFNKAVNGPKVDCADLSLLLRFSFAAWYRLPIYLVGYDGNVPIHFGHFGVRTATGKWSQAPSFATQFPDHSSMPPAQYMASWPQDTALRTRGILPDDEIPFLGPGARLGAFLDEIHLNKRAARLILFVQAYLGSHNMADSRNTYNLAPEALRPGDILIFRRAPAVAGHATVVTRVAHVGPGNMKAEAVYGNLPPAQPVWQSPAATRSLFTNNEGGGPTINSAYGGTTTFSRLNGGAKRFRVAKVKNGKWMNTWMEADEASWINDTDYDRIGARIAQFAALLADPDPAVQRDQLLSVIQEKRDYLRDHPSSCAARTNRENTFAQLYTLMQTSFGMDRAAVDAAYRVIDDYVFAPLDYSKSRTCCWNSTTRAMYEIIMSYQASQTGNGCVAPTTFKLTANSYDPFASFAAASGRGSEWVPWSADEACAPASATDDVMIPDPQLTPWCSLPANQ
jgi:hypothetical protein